MFQNKEQAFRLYLNYHQCYLIPIYSDIQNYIERMNLIYNLVLQIHLPQLHHHFRLHSIEPLFYTFNWFNILFTDVYQRTNMSYLVVDIIETQLLLKQRGVVIAIMLILSHLKEEILKLEHDELILYFQNIIQKEIFINKIYSNYLEQKNIYNQAKLNEMFKKNLKDIKFVETFKQNIYDFKITQPIFEVIQDYLL